MSRRSSSSIRGVDLNSEESLPGMNRGGVHYHHHGRQQQQQQQQKQHESSLVQQLMIGRSWSQLLLENSVEEEGECTYAPIFESSTNVQSLVDHVLKEDISYRGNFEDHHREDEQGTSRSPRSCVTTSFSSNNHFLDFSNSSSKAAQRKQNHQADHHLSPDKWNGNSTSGPSLKKARVQASSVLSPLKVRKEKLGDRIAALHQLVSPFGKTDTASVLLEAIGYIRFLHGQIQALSSPYLGRASRDSTSSHGYHRVDDGDREGGEDLRSRGLCLAPASFTLQVEKDSAAPFWPPNNLEMGVYDEKLTY